MTARIVAGARKFIVTLAELSGPVEPSDEHDIVLTAVTTPNININLRIPLVIRFSQVNWYLYTYHELSKERFLGVAPDLLAGSQPCYLLH
jgi:hypothetical protein